MAERLNAGTIIETGGLTIATVVWAMTGIFFWLTFGFGLLLLAGGLIHEIRNRGLWAAAPGMHRLQIKR